MTDLFAAALWGKSKGLRTPLVGHSTSTPVGAIEKRGNAPAPPPTFIPHAHKRGGEFFRKMCKEIDTEKSCAPKKWVHTQKRPCVVKKKHMHALTGAIDASFICASIINIHTHTCMYVCCVTHTHTRTKRGTNIIHLHTLF